MKKILLALCLMLGCLVAVADYSAALEINPHDARLYEARAMFRTFRHDHAGAEKEFALHLRVFPGNRESLNARIEEARKLRAQPPTQ